MAEVFHLPAIGDAMAEGEIVEWFVAVGDTVALDQVICSVETDKSVVEMSTPFGGTVLQLGGEPGDVLEVGAPLIVIGQPGEAVPEAGPVVAVAAPAAVSPASTGADPSAGIAGPAAEPAVLAMPKVRQAARQQGVDLRGVVGTGPKGSVTLGDLPGPVEGVPAGAGDGGRRERLSAVRRAVARHLAESAQTVPQFTAMVDVDATALLQTRRALADRLGAPVPVDAVVMALLIPVLRDHPICNALLDGEDVVFFDRYDIGVAVDTPEGLMVPVVRAADQRPVGDIAAEIVRLAAAARQRTITPEELTGASCTINNVGAVGILAGTPILPLGTSSIVAFGRVHPVVELRDGNPVEVPTMTISATFDHRIIDGGHSGRFLTQLKQHLEVPALGLL